MLAEALANMSHNPVANALEAAANAPVLVSRSSPSATALGEPYAEWPHHGEPVLLIIAERWDALVVNSPRSLICIVERPLLKVSTRTLVPKMKC
jgi:hypothetical protein